jgi:hypothetical protein
MRLLHSVSFVFGALMACSSSSEITASSYDQQCASNSDCIAVAQGEDGCCGVSECPNAAINASAEAQYESDVASRKNCQAEIECPALACATYTAVCVNGMCRVGPEVPDGGSTHP